MLTVRQALKLPVFSGSRLVAGQAGLDNSINWVHIVDIPDARYEWQRQGVLLLTAGFGLRDDLERQIALVPKLVAEGFAGMVLATGYYFEQVPQVILKDAEAMAFPVIEAPPDLLFIEVTEAILERIVNKQNALLQRSVEIYEQLTEHVLQGADLHDLAETLAQLLKRSVTIESPSFHVLANARYGPVDAARERSETSNRTTPEVAQHLLDAGIYDQLLQQKRPLRVTPVPELDMHMERFVAPIIVDREIYGYIWIISGDRPLTELDELAISQGATVAALIRFKEQAVRQAREDLRGNFFDRLLRGESDANAPGKPTGQIRFRYDRPHQVLLLHGLGPQMGTAVDTLSDNIIRKLHTENIYPLYAWRDEQLVIVVESKANDDGKQIAARLVHEFDHPALRILVGLGSVCQPFDDDPNGIRQSYEQAKEALQIGRKLGQTEGTVSFDELGVLHWLYQLSPEQWAGNAYLNHIQTLAAYDAKRGSDLVDTLEAYLDHGGALAETAKTLFIHRNTLLHRLERIEQLCLIDLRAPIHRLNLHVAIKSHRLHPNRETKGL